MLLIKNSFISSTILSCLLCPLLAQATGANVFLGENKQEYAINSGVNHDLSSLFIGGDYIGGYTIYAGRMTAVRLDVGRTGLGSLNQVNGLVEVTSENLGWKAQGIYTQEGGTNRIFDILYMGSYDSGDGTYYLNDGILVAGNEIRVGNGGKATFYQNGGLNTSYDMTLGYYSAANAYYEQNDGEVQVDNDLKVGRSGIGTYLQDGASSIVHITDDLSIGTNYSGDGRYDLLAGELTIDHNMSVGEYGNGNFFQGDTPSINASGPLVNVDSTLYIADDSSLSTGTYTLNSGFLTTGSEQIGDEGNGRFTQNGGSHTVNGSVYIGQ